MKKIITAILFPIAIMTAGVCMTMYNAGKEEKALLEQDKKQQRQDSISLPVPASIKISGQPVYLSASINRQTVFLKV